MATQQKITWKENVITFEKTGLSFDITEFLPKVVIDAMAKNIVVRYYVQYGVKQSYNDRANVKDIAKCIKQQNALFEASKTGKITIRKPASEKIDVAKADEKVKSMTKAEQAVWEKLKAKIKA